MAIEGILFDLGKVLIDFSMEPMVRYLAANSRKSEDDFRKVLLDPQQLRRYETGELSTQEFYDYLCSEGGLQMDIAGFRSALTSVFAPDLLVSEDLLRSLHERYPMVIVSNTNEVHAEYLLDHYRDRIFDHFD